MSNQISTMGSNTKSYLLLEKNWGGVGGVHQKASVTIFLQGGATQSECHIFPAGGGAPKSECINFSAGGVQHKASVGFFLCKPKEWINFCKQWQSDLPHKASVMVFLQGGGNTKQVSCFFCRGCHIFPAGGVHQKANVSIFLQGGVQHKAGVMFFR